MARRKKQPAQFHREAIASAAAELFEKRGIEAVSMDEIARLSGYSKATVYVYFKNKDELVSLLTLESMRRLHERITCALSQSRGTRERYLLICRELTGYQKRYPFYFKMALEKIKLEPGAQSDYGETFGVGEDINGLVAGFIREGMERGELRRDMEPLPAVFAFWGALSGLIQLAAGKAEYIQSAMGMSSQQFLDYGFELLYRGIAVNMEGGETA